MNKLKQLIKNKLGEKNTAKIKKALPAVRVIKNIVCWILIAVMALAIVTFLLTRASGNTPSFFGYSLHRIVSGSMETELEVGDVLLSQAITDISEIHMGDIVTFSGGEQFDNREITHRVLVAPYDDGRGNVVLVTKGDANESDDGEISVSDVKSKFVKKLGFIKWIYNFFFSVWGLVIFIFLLLLIFVDEIIIIVRLSSNHDEEEDEESFWDTVKRIEQEEQEKSDVAEKEKRIQSKRKKRPSKPTVSKRIVRGSKKKTASEKKSSRKANNIRYKKSRNKNSQKR